MILFSDCRNKNYNITTDEQNFFDQLVKKKKNLTYLNLTQHITVFKKLQQVNEIITQLIFPWTFFKDQYKMIAIDLDKQQVFDTDP